MSVWSKIRGTLESLWQIGGTGGPQVKNNAGVIELRNSADSGFAVGRVASPVNDNDIATKQYVDTLYSRVVVALQFNGGNALPSNTSTEQFYVVTTTGANATIGQLLWDDGSNSGTVTVLAAKAQMIITTSAFSGGTVTLKADTPYVWDTGSSSWVNAGGTSQSGAIREIRYTLNNSATQDSANTIPANAQVTNILLSITTAYSGGATLSVGQSGSTSLLMGTGDNTPQTVGVYIIQQDTAWGGSALAVRTTVSGAPAAGAAQCIVQYTVADN